MKFETNDPIREWYYHIKKSVQKISTLLLDYISLRVIKFFFRNPITQSLLSYLLIIPIFAFLYFYIKKMDIFYDYVIYTITTLIQCEVTLLAILVSLTLLAVQWTATTYSSNVTEIYKKDKSLNHLIIPYIIVLFLDLALLLYLSSIHYTNEGNISDLLIISILALLVIQLPIHIYRLKAYTIDTLDLLNPIKIVEKTINSIECNKSPDDLSYQSVFDIVFSSIKNKDKKTVDYTLDQILKSYSKTINNQSSDVIKIKLTKEIVDNLRSCIIELIEHREYLLLEKFLGKYVEIFKINMNPVHQEQINEILTSIIEIYNYLLNTNYSEKTYLVFNLLKEIQKLVKIKLEDENQDKIDNDLDKLLSILFNFYREFTEILLEKQEFEDIKEIYKEILSIGKIIPSKNNEKFRKIINKYIEQYGLWLNTSSNGNYTYVTPSWIECLDKICMFWINKSDTEQNGVDISDLIIALTVCGGAALDSIYTTDNYEQVIKTLYKMGIELQAYETNIGSYIAKSIIFLSEYKNELPKTKGKILHKGFLKTEIEIEKPKYDELFNEIYENWAYDASELGIMLPMSEEEAEARKEEYENYDNTPEIREVGEYAYVSYEKVEIQMKYEYM